MRRFLMVAPVIALASAASANAATITYSDASQVPYLQQFDPTLGTLTSVTFNNRYVRSLYFDYSGDPSIQTGPIIRISGLIGDARFGLVSIDDLFQTSKQDPRTISVTISRSVTTTFYDGLSYYVGNRLMPVAAFGNLTSPGLSPAVVSFPSPFSYVSVTYNYIAGVGAIPEPTTWLTMLIGFGLIGAITRYRRRGVQVRYA